MDEKRDEIRNWVERRGERRRGIPSHPGSLPGETGFPHGTDRDPEQIRADIERTRGDMTETVDEIKERLSPENLKEQAKERVREATIGRARGMAEDMGKRARGMRYAIVETVRENPVPALLVGLGLAWLYRERRTGYEPGETSSYREYGQSEYGGYRETPSESRFRRWGREASSWGQEKTSGLKETAENVQEKAAEVAGQAKQKVEQVGDVAQEKVRQARSGFDRMLRENPLMVAVAALAVGAAVGLAIPETETEHEYMGEAKDRLMSKAREVGRDVSQKVQDVSRKVSESAEQVKKAASE
jgi:ElaB/YqjD/DUF883 family membrane-anchored ribosome-binding protein